MMTAIAALGTLIACSSPTKYQPKEDGKFGYENTKLKEDVYRVSFKGNSNTDRETVEDSMMYRIAELTKKAGYTHFEILEKDTEILKDVDVNYTSNALAGPYSTGYYGDANYRYPYYSYGTPWSYGRNRLEVDTMFETLAYVRMHKKEDKKYDYRSAQSVMEKLKPKLEFEN